MLSSSPIRFVFDVVFRSESGETITIPSNMIKQTISSLPFEAQNIEPHLFNLALSYAYTKALHMKKDMYSELRRPEKYRSLGAVRRNEELFTLLSQDFDGVFRVFLNHFHHSNPRIDHSRDVGDVGGMAVLFQRLSRMAWYGPRRTVQVNVPFSYNTVRNFVTLILVDTSDVLIELYSRLWFEETVSCSCCTRRYSGQECVSFFLSLSRAEQIDLYRLCTFVGCDVFSSLALSVLTSIRETCARITFELYAPFYRYIDDGILAHIPEKTPDEVQEIVHLCTRAGLSEIVDSLQSNQPA